MIDLRSDTVTQPDEKMRQCMAEARVGDDVYGDDPTVNELQSLAAEISGKQAALFVPSGTQSNLIALLCHCQRGDEYIVGQQAHTYKYEAGGAAVLGSIQPQPIEFEADGSLDLSRVKAAIKPDDAHFAKTKLFCIENTQGGKIIPQTYIEQAATLCKNYNLNFHLDGARIVNAAVATGNSIASLCEPFDSVSICLSKGLGAPVGSVLCASQAFVDQGKRWRKMLGGGMRQAGILAAAGIYALKNNVNDLKNDHKKADYLFEKLSENKNIKMQADSAKTNMVFVKFNSDRINKIIKAMQQNNILISIENNGVCRLVLHRDITNKDVDFFIKKINKIA
ncbi:MAG TPA: low-specificity L-threonine aldolase [Aeromonadales bacterium]|nr:low-specificity L-threonine aldolase [Aeromonadales bacterium]